LQVVIPTQKAEAPQPVVVPVPAPQPEGPPPGPITFAPPVNIPPTKQALPAQVASTVVCDPKSSGGWFKNGVQRFNDTRVTKTTTQRAELFPAVLSHQLNFSTATVNLIDPYSQHGSGE